MNNKEEREIKNMREFDVILGNIEENSLQM
jgi:hypothetical protein